MRLYAPQFITHIIDQIAHEYATAAVKTDMREHRALLATTMRPAEHVSQLTALFRSQPPKAPDFPMAAFFGGIPVVSGLVPLVTSFENSLLIRGLSTFLLGDGRPNTRIIASARLRVDAPVRMDAIIRELCQRIASGDERPGKKSALSVSPVERAAQALVYCGPEALDALERLLDDLKQQSRDGRFVLLRENAVIASLLRAGSPRSLRILARHFDDARIQKVNASLNNSGDLLRAAPLLAVGGRRMRARVD